MTNEINVKQKFADILKEFCNQIGIAEVELDADQNCLFTFNDDIIVNIHYNLESDTVFTYGLVGVFGTQFNREALLMRMANDNFFWEKSNGFTLAIDGSNDNVVIHDRRYAGWFIDADAFAAYLENCINVVTEWRELLALQTDENDDRPDDDTDDGDFIKFNV